MINIPESFLLKTKRTPFPDVELALTQPNGLIALGGDLSTDRLLTAYSQGIFPWYSKGEPILWYSPNPRMIITLEHLRISKSLNKALHLNTFQTKVDIDFDSVVYYCKTVKRKNQSGTWIDDDMVKAYTKLYAEGFAHCVCVYQNFKLVGGLYGVVLGSVFFGESMFSLVPNASKIAFVHLLQNMNYKLIDCQVENLHLKSLGAINVKRSVFIKLLQELL